MRLTLLLSCILSSACASTPEAPEPVSGAQKSVERLAVTLVDLASRRTDLNTIRAAILPFQGETNGGTGGVDLASSGSQPDLVDAELQREFELALANRLHLVEPTWSKPAPSAALPAPGALGAASHALLGEYSVRDKKLILSVRLVELESSLVLSAARDELPLSWFSPRAVAQLRPPALTTPPRITATRPAAATTSGRIEDYETWRARRTAEEAAAVQIVPPPTPGAPSSSKHELMPFDPDPAPSSQVPPPQAALYPWRRNYRLAELLGIPLEKRPR